MYARAEVTGRLRGRGLDWHTVRDRHAFQAIYWVLRCTCGKNHETRLLPRAMFRFLNWYHSSRPAAVERVEAVANLVMGKDMIMYTRKPASDASAGETSPSERAGAAD